MIQPLQKKMKLRRYFGLILMVLWMVLTLNAMEFAKNSDLIVNTIRTFEKHPRILKIKDLNSGCKISVENLSFQDFKKVT